MENTALQPTLGQPGEEGLDGIDPGCRGRRVMEGPARMAREPGANLGMFVAAVIVENDVDQLAGGDLALEAVEKRRNS